MIIAAALEAASLLVRTEETARLHQPTLCKSVENYQINLFGSDCLHTSFTHRGSVYKICTLRESIVIRI